MSKHSIVKKRVQVHAPIETVFDVFIHQTDNWWPTSHRSIEGSRMVFEAQPGGRIIEVGPDGAEKILGIIQQIERPNWLAYSWVPGSELGPTQVEIQFSSIEGGTVIEVSHSVGKSGLSEEDWPKRAERFNRAWDHLLPFFAEYLDKE